MSHIFNGAEIKAYTFNSDKAKKRYLNGKQYWSAGSTVTYYVDSGMAYTVEVDSGADVLSPTSFTPSKDGWTFVGWREDTSASSSVLSSKVMESEPITLYAVFERNCVLTCISYNSRDTVNGVAYYNNGNVSNAHVTTPQGASYSGWTFRGWTHANDTAADAAVWKEAGAYGDIDTSDYTVYGLYQKTVTAHFISGYAGASDQPASGNVYYNAAGNVSTITLTVPNGAAISGWTWRGWSKYWDRAAAADVFVANGGTVTINDSNDGITYYGLYQKTVTANFYSGLSKGNHQTVTGTGYYNSAGNMSTVDITAPSGASVSGWSWRGWAQYWSESATASVFLANGAKTTIQVANDGITYYGLYQQTITLSYNGNGATSGSVTAQTGTRYHNSAGNYSNPTFALAGNGYARSGYSFTGWNLGAAGASITLDVNATAYAQWTMVSILVSGVWQSSASSVNNGVMSYDSAGYLTTNIATKDGTTNFAGPSFNVDTTGLSTISFELYLSGYRSTDADGSCTITFTINGKSAGLRHRPGDAYSHTLTVDVSAMSGVQTCTCSMVEDCRSEDDASGWTSNHTVRILNITPV